MQGKTKQRELQQQLDTPLLYCYCRSNYNNNRKHKQEEITLGKLIFEL